LENEDAIQKVFPEFLQNEAWDEDSKPFNFLLSLAKKGAN